MSGQKIIPKTQTKYLALVLEEHLTWSAQINILKKNYVQQVIFFQNKDKVLRRIYLSLYTMYFLFHIFHMVLKYGDNQKTK